MSPNCRRARRTGGADGVCANGRVWSRISVSWWRIACMGMATKSTSIIPWPTTTRYLLDRKWDSSYDELRLGGDPFPVPVLEAVCGTAGGA